MTSLPTSPWEKMVSFGWNSTMFLATPAESRKAWALKLAGRRFFVFFVMFKALKPLLSWIARAARIAPSLIF